MALKRSHMTVPAGMIASMALLAWTFWPNSDPYVYTCGGAGPRPDGYVLRIKEPLPAGTVLNKRDLHWQFVHSVSTIEDEAERQFLVEHMVTKREAQIVDGYRLPEDMEHSRPITRDELNLKPAELD